MSPVSRGRRRKSRTKSGHPALVVVGDGPDQCDCPEWSGEDAELAQLVDSLVSGAADLVDCEDPLEAELAGAIFVAMASADGDEAVSLLAESLIPEIEARGDAAAVALLTAIGSAAGGASAGGGPAGGGPAGGGLAELAGAAVAVARRMTAGGLPEPAWAHKLEQPLGAGPMYRRQASRPARRLRRHRGLRRTRRGPADPSHPEHADRLEWLGLDDVTQFAPNNFDPDEVNRRLIPG